MAINWTSLADSGSSVLNSQLGITKGITNTEQSKRDLAALPISNTVENNIASSLATYKSKLLGNNSGHDVGNNVQYIIPTSNSDISSLNSAVSSNDYSAILDYLKNVSDSNTAKSIELANSQNKWQEEQNAKAMEFNSKEAALNREWQEMMSNTAHQREVQDLIAAGLNPVLSATGGNGASVTSGATASGVTSSGSKGEVDTSVSSALGSFLNSLLSSATAITTAGISSAATLGAAEKNAQATKYSSTVNSVSDLVGSVLRLIGLKYYK